MAPRRHNAYYQLRFLSAAARGGDVALIKWLVSRMHETKWGEIDEVTTHLILQNAVLSRNLKMLQYLTGLGFCISPTASAIVTATRIGDTEMVKEILTAYAKQPPVREISVAAYREAAARGDRQLFELLIDGLADHEWDDECITTAAAKKGSLEILKFCNERGIPWDETACSTAAEYGHLEVLKYLHENGCFRDENDACFRAALDGHLHVLKWAHEEMGYSWNFAECLSAAEDHQHDAVVRWMKSLPQPQPKPKPS